LASIKLRGGGFVKLDRDDFSRIKDYIFYACEINTKSGPRIVIKSDQLNCKYLHCFLFPKSERSNKVLLHIDNNIYNYERSNIVLVPSNRRKKVTLNNIETIHRKIPTPLGIILNHCVIAPNNDRELECAACSHLDLNRYEECLDVAAIHAFPGWKILQYSDWCEEIKVGLIEEKRSRSINRETNCDPYDNQHGFLEGDCPFSQTKLLANTISKTSF
jgi:hypothetical protein